MAVTLSEIQFQFLQNTLSSLAAYLEQRATDDEEAAKHLVELEEALVTLQSVEVDRTYNEAIADGVIQTKGGSFIV